MRGLNVARSSHLFSALPHRPIAEPALQKLVVRGCDDHSRILFKCREVCGERFYRRSKNDVVGKLHLASEMPSDDGFQLRRSHLHVGGNDGHALARGEAASRYGFKVGAERPQSAMTCFELR